MAAAAPTGMDIVQESEDEAPEIVTGPCDWDNEDRCAECRHVRCATCYKGKICENCENGAPKMCFAFCDFNEEICRTQGKIDFDVWQETYVAVRCLRDRVPRNFRKASRTDQDQFLQQFFPGFCREHNTKDEYYADFTRKFWHPMDWKFKALTNFMVTADRCGLHNMDTFISDQKDPAAPDLLLYRDTTIFDIWKNVLFSPTGIMAVDAMYFNIYLVQTIDKMQEEYVFSNPDLQRHLQGKTTAELVHFDAAAWIRRFQDEFAGQTMTYDFILDYVLQDKNMEWLQAGDDACRRVLNWNMLVHKLTIMFTFCFYPVNFRASIPRFDPMWRSAWDAKSSQYFSQKFTDQAAYRKFVETTWNDFMNSMEIMVRTIDDSAKNVPVPDPRPEPNVYKFLTECKRPTQQ